jgi:hypothetical protein
MNNHMQGSLLFLFATFLCSSGGAGVAHAEEMQGSGSEASALVSKSSPAPAGELYVGVFGGGARYADAQVSATYQCFFCSPVSASKNVTFSKGSVSGLRVGMWGETFGFATEFSVAQADSMMSGNQVSVRYESFTFMPMLSMPFFKTDSMPGGHLNLYGGIGISTVQTGNISVSYTELPRTVSGMPKGNGTTFLIGVSWKIYRAILFVEQRATDTSLTFSDIGDHGDVQMNARQTLLGAAFRF